MIWNSQHKFFVSLKDIFPFYWNNHKFSLTTFSWHVHISVQEMQNSTLLPLLNMLLEKVPYCIHRKFWSSFCCKETLSVLTKIIHVLFVLPSAKLTLYSKYWQNWLFACLCLIKNIQNSCFIFTSEQSLVIGNK